MSVKAIIEDFRGEVRDAVDNFNGKQVVYLAWDKHLFFCSAFAYLVDPQMTFRAFIEEFAKPTIAPHPQSKEINWDATQWLNNGQRFTPDWNTSLASNGIGHKSSIRMQTPGLEGLYDAAF